MSNHKFLAYIANAKGGADIQLWHGDQTNGLDQFKRGAVGTGDLLDFMRVPDTLQHWDLTRLAEEFPYEGPQHWSKKQLALKERRHTTMVKR